MEQPGRVAQMVPEPAPAAISATSETRDAEALWTETQCDDPQLHAVRFLLRALSGEVDVASVARVLSLRGDLSALVALSVDPAYSAAVTALVGALAAAGEEAVLEEVELAVLEKAGVAANAEVLARKAVRCRTARFYTQRKFNLFREESEGFAKLLVALQSGTGRGLKELVGAFGLDPNRVLDLLLDIAEMRKLEGRNEIEDVDWHDFSASSIANILGFKISNASEGQEWIGFVKVAAMLLKANVIELNQIYTHLSPEDEALSIEAKNYDTKVKDACKSLLGVNLNRTNQEEEAESPLVPYYSSRNMKFFLVAELFRNGASEQANLLCKHLGHTGPFRDPDILDAYLDHVLEFLLPFSLGLKSTRIFHSESMDLDGTFHHFMDEEDIVKLKTMLDNVPIYLWKKPKVFSLICRILAESFDAKGNNQIIEDIICDCLLPSYSFFKANGGISEDLWRLLLKFPFATRYSFYASWVQAPSIHSELQFLTILLKKQVKSLLKRISVDNVKDFSRSLTRLAYNNPLVVVDLLLDQLEMFDNFCELCAEVMTYFTSLNLDVVCFILLKHLSVVGRPKVKEDGFNPSQWLQGLFTFTGAFFKKFPEVLFSNPSVIEYALNYLFDQESHMEIAILSEFLSNLCGVSVKENMTLYQILGQGGGGTLRAQIIDSSHFKEKVRRQMPAIDNVLKSNSMLVAFLISVAQKKQLLIFKGRTHVKALGNLVDKHQDVLLQLVEYIAANPALKKRLRLTLPSMEELKTKYYLTSEDIFLIYRPLFEGISFVEPKNVEKANEVGGEANNAVSTSSDNRVESGSFSPTASVDHLSKEIEFKNALLDSVSSLLPASAVSSLSRSFYAAFWAHSLYDIYVPHQQYDSALESLSKQTTKGGSERKKLLKCKDALTSERDKQVENHKIVMSKFSEDKDKWFENCSYGEESISAFLQYCILPRVICSDYDAVYCSKFLAIVHQLSTPGFYTSLFFHWLVEILPTFVATCTQKEAMRFGLFVHDVLALLHHWRSTEELYNEHFMSKAGACISFQKNDDHKMEFSKFVGIVAVFHKKLTDYFCASLSSESYLPRRNALLILTKLSGEFPKVSEFASEIVIATEKIVNDADQKGSDVQTMAKLVNSALKSSKSGFISQCDFSPKASYMATSTSSTLKTDVSNEVPPSKEAIIKPKTENNSVIKSPEASNSGNSALPASEKSKNISTVAPSLSKDEPKKSITEVDVKPKGVNTEKPVQLKSKEVVSSTDTGIKNTKSDSSKATSLSLHSERMGSKRVSPERKIDRDVSKSRSVSETSSRKRRSDSSSSISSSRHPPGNADKNLSYASGDGDKRRRIGSTDHRHSTDEFRTSIRSEENHNREGKRQVNQRQSRPREEKPTSSHSGGSLTLQSSKYQQERQPSRSSRSNNSYSHSRRYQSSDSSSYRRR